MFKEKWLLVVYYMIKQYKYTLFEQFTWKNFNYYWN